jgi:hypothetical protein
MKRAALLLLASLLLPAVCFASPEGNPDVRPSVAIRYGLGWGDDQVIDDTLHDTVPGTASSLERSVFDFSFRLPVHRAATAEIGYLYDGQKFSSDDFPAHTRGRFHLVSVTMRFYFGK